MEPPSSKATSVATIDFQLACETHHSLPAPDDMERWVSAVLTHHQIDAAELTIRAVDIAESQQLNADYRGKDKPTNVLSFPFDSDMPLPVRLLGDLVICVPVMTEEATDQHKELMHHWAHLIIHGTLHLLGYDHIEDDEADHMERLEVELLKQFDIPDPYYKGANSVL